MDGVITPNLKFYIDKLDVGTPFSFVRYGNGEWDLVLGRGTRTGSGSQWFSSDLRNAMRNTLLESRSGDYYYAIQSRKYLKRLRLLLKVKSWLSNNSCNLDWYCGEVFHRSSMQGKLFPLIKSLHNMPVVIVGPSWLRKLRFADNFIEVKSKNCWQDVDEIEEQIRVYNNSVIGFSAGPTTKVLIHRLYPEMGKHSWLIDFGSLWDVYCGKPSRRYQKRIGEEVMQRNFGEYL